MDHEMRIKKAVLDFFYTLEFIACVIALLLTSCSAPLPFVTYTCDSLSVLLWIRHREELRIENGGGFRQTRFHRSHRGIQNVGVQRVDRDRRE
jgi:hypothetical protein